MIKTPWTPKEVTFLIGQRSQGVSHSAIAKALGRSLNSVSNKAQDLESLGLVEKIPLDKCTKRIKHILSLKEEVLQLPSFDGFLQFTGDFLAISDIHIPYPLLSLIEKACRIGRKFKIKRLHIIGDFLNADAFSRFPTGNRGEEYQDREFRIAGKVLEMMLDAFQTIVYTMGNHEERFRKAMSSQIGLKQLLLPIHKEMGKRILVSESPKCEIDEKILCVHPSQFSQEGGKFPAALAGVEERNIIAGHNHQLGFQCSSSGKYWGMDHGWGGDASKIEYYQKSVNTVRKWQNGFSMVRNGKPYLFSEQFTDWGYWLK